MKQMNGKKGDKDKTQPGVWNRGLGRDPKNPIRVRTKRLDQIDSDKIALAYWLLAKQLAENQTDAKPLTEAEVRRVASEIEPLSPPPASSRRRNGSGARRRKGA